MPDSLLPNILEFIARVDPFDQLPQALQEQVAKVITISYLARGEQLALDDSKDGSYLYMVRSGALEQRKADGSLRARLGPEDSFGFTFLEPIKSIFDGYSAVAIENTLLYQVPHAKLTQLLIQHPEYALHFAASAQERLHSAMHVKWSSKEKGLFVRRVSDIASKKVAVVAVDHSIQQVAREMRDGCRSDLAVVMDGDTIAGVITDGDMTRRVVAEGLDIGTPVREVMTRQPCTIGPDDLVIKAVSLMMENNLRSLPVIHEQRVVGQLTTSHLVQNHRVQAVFLMEKMKGATSLEELVVLAPERQAVFEALVEGRVNAPVIGKVMALIMDAFNRRLIELALDDLGPPPCDFAWVVAGSHARNEVHASSDQDSALVLADDATETDRGYFLRLGEQVCRGMTALGYATCPGNFMASNPQWCQPLAIWQDYYRQWITQPGPQSLLNSTVFLEVRALYGKGDLSEQLQNALHQHIADHPAFLSALVQDSATVQPPLGIFNKLVVEKGGKHSNTLNLKRHALTLLVDLARIYALACGSQLNETEQRFEAAWQRGRLEEESYKNVVNAYRFLIQVRYDHQLAMLQQGLPTDSHIAPDSLGSFERGHLKDAFRIIATFQESAKLRFGG